MCTPAKLSVEAVEEAGLARVLVFSSRQICAVAEALEAQEIWAGLVSGQCVCVVVEAAFLSCHHLPWRGDAPDQMTCVLANLAVQGAVVVHSSLDL